MKVNRIFRASWDHSTVEINSAPAGVYRRGTKPSCRTSRVAQRRSYLNGKVSGRPLSFPICPLSLLLFVRRLTQQLNVRSIMGGNIALSKKQRGPLARWKIMVNYWETAGEIAILLLSRNSAIIVATRMRGCQRCCASHRFWWLRSLIGRHIYLTVNFRCGHGD